MAHGTMICTQLHMCLHLRDSDVHLLDEPAAHDLHGRRLAEAAACQTYRCEHAEDVETHSDPHMTAPAQQAILKQSTLRRAKQPRTPKLTSNMYTHIGPLSAMNSARTLLNNCG